MGACVSSAILGPEPSESEKSPIGENPASKVTCSMTDKCQISSAKFNSFGSKDDVFFDAQPWLDSDAEDNFHSAKGDLTPYITPYSSTTPVHRNISGANTRFPENKQVKYRLVQTPEFCRKSLSELFLESDNECDISNGISKIKMDGEDTKEFKENELASTSAKSALSESEVHSSSLKSEISTTKNSKKQRSSKSAQCFPKIFLMHSPKSPNKKTSMESSP